MTKKNIFPVVATIAVVGVVLGVFSMTVMRDSNISTNTMTTEQAYANLSSKMKRIGVQEVSVNPQQLDVSEFLDAKDELPNIDSSYPFVVEGNGDVNIEIFSSGEKAAESGSDSFLTSMAKKFNAQHNKTSGDKTMSVSLRSVPSGTAAEYISTGKYQPECYTPSNTLFGELVKNEGVELTVEADRLVGNVAGILVSKKTGDMLRSEYGEASVSSVLNATIDGKIMMGYSNPYTSATGLNFLLEALASSGSDTIVDTAAVENFQKFQANVPLVSFTTQQMVQSADKGIVDGVVMEYQSYQNDPTLQRNYEFIPFGVRHDNPLYSIGSISAEKKEVIAAFVSLCAQNQAEATKDGFNGLDDYAYTGKAYDGNTIAQAQSARTVTTIPDMASPIRRTSLPVWISPFTPSATTTQRIVFRSSLPSTKRQLSLVTARISPTSSATCLTQRCNSKARFCPRSCSKRQPPRGEQRATGDSPGKLSLRRKEEVPYASTTGSELTLFHPLRR